jgi:hypothetical protein
MPALIEVGRAHANEHLVIADHRRVDLPQLQDVG